MGARTIYALNSITLTLAVHLSTSKCISLVYLPKTLKVLDKEILSHIINFYYVILFFTVKSNFSQLQARNTQGAQWGQPRHEPYG